jgi:hypothetical protein
MASREQLGARFKRDRLMSRRVERPNAQGAVIHTTSGQMRRSDPERTLQSARADYTQGSFGHRDWPRAMAIQPQTR